MSVQSVSRAIAILQSFTADVPLLGIADLGRQLDLDRSAVMRAVATLVGKDLLEQDPVSGKYRLGFGLLEMAGTMLQGHNLPTVVHPFLRELADLVGECARLSVLYREDSVLQIEEATSAHLIGYSGWTGSRLPLYCTASGRVLLAYMESERQDRLLSSIKLLPRTSSTITDPDELRQELVAVREQGYSITLGEFLDGIYAVAAPVLGPEGGMPVALTLVGPKFRFTEEKVRACTGTLSAVANEISVRLPHSLFNR